MKVVISAGGTGGHIYPAISIIKKIQEKEPNSKFIYIGTHNRMEKDIIPKMNIEYIPLEIYGFSKKLIKRDIKNIGLIFKAKRKCEKIIKKFQPDVVLGIGGYVTYPVIKAAKKLNIPIFLHEQNSIPGKTNKSLAKLANVVGTSFENSKKYFKGCNAVYTGNPVTSNITYEKISLKKFGLKDNLPLILIVSGSLGSQTVNNKFKKFLNNLNTNDYQIIYITGKDYYDDFIKDTNFKDNIKIFPFIDNLKNVMKKATIMISRAGASTISEIISLSVPTIFIPSPYVANNHQYYNALSLVQKNAALLIEEKDLNEKSIKNNIDKLFSDKNLYAVIQDNLSSIKDNFDSAEEIYNIIKELVK